MQIKSISLSNFKIVGNTTQTIELAPITLLFGPNSAGKSTILQALVYLREIIEHRNLDPDVTELGGNWLDLGGFKNFVHGHDKLSPIRIGVTLDLSDSNLPNHLSDVEFDALDDEGAEFLDYIANSIDLICLNFEILWSEELDKPIVRSYEVSSEGKLLGRIYSTSDGKQVQIDRLDLGHPSLQGEESELGHMFGLFSQRFKLAIDSNRISRSNLAVDKMLRSKRPFKNSTAKELAELVDDFSNNKKILKVIKRELGFRTTRAALNLSLEITHLLDQSVLDNSDLDEKLIVLLGQNDALPKANERLALDPTIWHSDAPGDYTEISGDQLKLFIETLVSMVLVGPLDVLANVLDKFTFIGPLRSLPDRNWSAPLSANKSRWATGLGAWDYLHSADERFIQSLNAWIGGDRLNTGYQFELKQFRELGIDHPLVTFLTPSADLDNLVEAEHMLKALPIVKKVTLVEERSGLEVMAQDIGVGISQVVPVVVAAIQQKSGVIAIEQPELHIHPAIQVELGDLFANYALEHNIQFLLETHSEHIILRLLRRIRESNRDGQTVAKRGLTKDMVAVHYIWPTEEGTKFKNLPINDNGDFECEWPRGFFDERDEELFF